LDGQVFRAVSATSTALVISTALVTTVPGGVLRRALQAMLGTAF